MIKLEHVCKSFGDLEVLKDISFTVEEGEKLVVIGSSGSGKSTMVRCMNFPEEPTADQVFIDGIELTTRNKNDIVRKNIAMVFQQFNLYLHMTVLQNIMLAPIKLQHVSKQDAEKIAYEHLDVVGLRDKAYMYPTTLSGGQQQRVTIVRALAIKQKIILFDEPTSALDPETVREVLDVVTQLSHINITMAVVTHEMGFVRQVTDRILLMDHGTILEEGKPEHFFENPTNERTKAFLSRILK